MTTQAQRCIDNIERIVRDRGGVISEPQRHLAAHCLRVPGTSTTLPVLRSGAQPQQPAEEASGIYDRDRLAADPRFAQWVAAQ